MDRKNSEECILTIFLDEICVEKALLHNSFFSYNEKKGRELR